MNEQLQPSIQVTAKRQPIQNCVAGYRVWTKNTGPGVKSGEPLVPCLCRHECAGNGKNEQFTPDLMNREGTIFCLNDPLQNQIE